VTKLPSPVSEAEAGLCVKGIDKKLHNWLNFS